MKQFLVWLVPLVIGVALVVWALTSLAHADSPTRELALLVFGAFLANLAATLAHAHFVVKTTRSPAQ